MLLTQKEKWEHLHPSQSQATGTNTVFFETEEETLQLVLLVSNYHHRNGGIWVFYPLKSRLYTTIKI